MKNIFIKLLILAIFISIFTFQASALSFSNLSVGGTGSINTGNGYFDDPQTAFSYSGSSRNVYALAEDTQINILEPIGFAGGSSNAYTVINSSFGTITDAVVNNGYLYFVDGGILKKKRNRGTTSPVVCESNDTSSGACIITIDNGINPTIRTFDNKLYYIIGTDLYHLDVDDNSVFDFSVGTPPGAGGSHNGFTVAENNSAIEVYIPTLSTNNRLSVCNSIGCTIIYTGANNFVQYNTLFTTTNTIFVYWRTAGSVTYQSGYYISNSSAFSETIITTSLNQYNRAYVGSYSTIGLWADTSTYETFNSNEAGIDSLPISEGSGLVEYVTKTVSVPNSNYYNDSVIPINVDLKFIITDQNFTNYQNTLFWHLRARDPAGIEVEDHDLPVICNQNLPWWDTFGVFSLFLIDNEEPWACDGTQTVMYSPTPGTKWANGTYEVDLTEQIPGTISVLSTDSWNIVNSTTGGTGTISPPSGGGGKDIQGRTDDFLSSGMMVVFIMLIIFAGAGQIIGGHSGAVIGFGGGFLFVASFGLIPMWALFLFAILIITAFATMMSEKLTGGGTG